MRHCFNFLTMGSFRLLRKPRSIIIIIIKHLIEMCRQSLGWSKSLEASPSYNCTLLSMSRIEEKRRLMIDLISNEPWGCQTNPGWLSSANELKQWSSISSWMAHLHSCPEVNQLWKAIGKLGYRLEQGQSSIHALNNPIPTGISILPRRQPRDDFRLTQKRRMICSQVYLPIPPFYEIVFMEQKLSTIEWNQ